LKNGKAKTMKVGFIGLGQMGSGMAANLVEAGHEVTVFNRSRAKAEPLVKKGARAAATVGEACDGEAVVTMLANDEAVESVVYGEKSILSSLKAGAIHISSSTISIALAERLTASHAAGGPAFCRGASVRTARHGGGWSIIRGGGRR
jgi:3-hydroxyisobutyrate dehydrogenase-like beta-hydroxyacid dehydrogenase